MASHKTVAAPAAKTSRPRRSIEQEAPAPRPAALRPAAEVASEEAAQASGEVIVNVPKAYKLIRDGHVEKAYLAGTQRMPRIDAEHWWSKAQGVTIPFGNDPEAAATAH